MVGHTGDFSAGKKAIKIVDAGVKEIIDLLLKKERSSAHHRRPRQCRGNDKSENRRN